jgi:hypothetical protein
MKFSNSFETTKKFSIVIFSCCADQEFFSVAEKLRESYKASRSE